MKSFKQILETVYRPKGGDEQAFLDKHVIDLQAHPTATEFQFKGAKPPKAKRKADYDEKEDEKVYEAAEVHTKRADKEPVIVRAVDPKTGASKAKTVMRRAGEIKIGEEVELDEISQDKLRDYHAAAGADRQKAKAEVQKGMKNPRPSASSVQKTADSYKRFVKRGKGMTAAANKMDEEVELEESITKMSDARLKFHATKNVPHGSYTRKEIESEHDRRKKTGGAEYASVKPSLNEDADLDEKVKNPYAVGMAAAMKSTGDTPPLKKSTIVKGHEIAKSIKKEAMDPVGKHDADIDNDGDVDKSDKYLIARRKAIGKALRKEEVELDEAKLSASQRDRLDDLILSVHTTTHPEYDGGELPQKYLKAIEKEFGAKIAKQVDDGSYQMHFGRDNQAHGHDKLASRQWSSKFKGGPRVTAGGKMNKQDISALKTRIKNDKKFGGLLKSVKLPEEVELDELKKSTLGSYVTKASYDAAKHAARYGSSSKPGSFVKAHQRLAGIKKASDKLAKEEVEQIDELSKKTLGSYVKKASADQYFKGQDAQYHDNKAKKAEGPFAKETKKKHYALAARANDKASNRDTGISRAVDRLTKEEVELDEAFKIGAMKLKDGSSVTLTRESVDALNGLFNQLNSANKSKMEERMMSGQKGFKEILSFAENV